MNVEITSLMAGVEKLHKHSLEYVFSCLEDREKFLVYQHADPREIATARTIKNYIGKLCGLTIADATDPVTALWSRVKTLPPEDFAHIRRLFCTNGD